MFFGLGMPELIIIVVIVLIIFGPKNLPKLGKSLGKTVKGIREGMDEAGAEGKGDDATAAKDVVVDKKDDEDADVEDVEDASAEHAASDSKFCPECGAKNPADNHFCSKCGHKLD